MSLNLDGIPFFTNNLLLKRPTKYEGPETNQGKWEDVLTKVMSGEIVVRDEGAAAPVEPPSAEHDIGASTVVELTNMVTMDDLSDQNEFTEILEDTRSEVSQFGNLITVSIPRTGTYATRIFLKYEKREGAEKAIKGLGGRTFDGKSVGARFFDEGEYESGVVNACE